MNRLYLLFIVAFLGWISLSFGAAPQIQSVDYVTKRYETSSIRANLVVVSASFDQELYFDNNCTETGEDLQILPCCSDSVTQNCYTPEVTNFCIDGEYGSDLSLDTNQFQTFEFSVENPATCDSVPILVRSLSGDPDVAVSVKLTNPTPTSTRNDYYFKNTGSDGVVLCCQDIRTLNPAWDGTVYFSVVAFAATTFQVVVEPSARGISITDAWFSMVPQIICANESFVFQDCVLDDDYCANLPPTSDPLFSYIATLTDLEEPLSYESQRISFTFASSVQVFTSSQVARTVFPFSASILGDSTCRVSFQRSLRNSAGELLTGSAAMELRQLTCVAEDYFRISDGLTQLLEDLQSSSFATEDDVFEYRLRSLAFAVSNAWLGCVRLTENTLLSATEVPTQVLSTTACFATDPSSDAYLNDPCCNPGLQTTQCCAARDLTVNAPSYTINFEAVNSTCNLPVCTTNALDQYVLLSQGALIRRDVCSLETQKALNDPLFNGDNTPLQTCQRLVFSTPCAANEDCLAIDVNSICLFDGYCSVPCRNNTECATGNCTTSLQGVRTCETYNLLDNVGDKETSVLVQCVERNTDRFVALFIRSELGVPYNSPPQTYVGVFLNTMINDQTCLGPVSTDYKYNTTACELVQSCNWAQCDSLSNPQCKQQNCIPPNDALGSPDFCGFCYGDNCVEVSTFPRCQYKGTFGATGSICTLFATTEGSGVFVGLPADNNRCIRETTTVDECFPPTRCTDPELAAQDCAPYCYIKDATDAGSCVGIIEDSTVQWTTWTRNSIVYGVCLAETHTSISPCLLNSTGRLRARTNWWPGTTYTEAQYATPATCLGICIPTDTITDEATCTSSFYCDGCDTCNNEGDCDLQGTCNDFAGCVTPLPPNNICPTNLQWSPVGCLAPNVTQASCTGPDQQWIPKALSRTECLDKGSVCFDPSTEQAPPVPYRPPPGISAKNESECSKCSGEILPYYEWRGAEWTENVWFNFQWRTRQFGQVNSLGRAIDNRRFSVFWRSAIAKRFANIMAREVLCRYGRSQDALDNIACDCAVDRSIELSQSCVSNISVITDAVIQCCRSIAQNTTSQSTKTRIEVRADFNTDSDVDCINLKVYSLPQTQFNTRKKLTLSSISASLPESGRSDQFRYVKNAKVAAVGELIGDGVQFEQTTLALAGLYACVPIPQLTKPLRQVTNTTVGKAAYLDFAYPDDSYSTLTLLGLQLPLGTTEYCFDLSTLEVDIVFPIVLIENYENISFIETISPGNLALIYIGVGIYLFVLGFTAFHFTIHIMQSDSFKGFWNMATSALLILFFMLILRFLYLIFLSNGVLETARAADVVFSELPALLYLTIYSLIVIRWAEIYHFTMTTGRAAGITKLRPVVISVNVLLGAAFIVLAVLFYTLNNTRVINCSTPATEERTDAEKVAIAYKVFFALISLGLSITFAVYGGRIVTLMHQTAKMAGKTRNTDRNKALTRLVIVSAVCAVALLAQAGNLLHSSLGTNRDFVGVLIFLYIVEIAPAIIFIFLFKRTSLFAQSADKKKAWVSSVRSRTKTGKGTTGSNLQDGTNTHGVGDDVIAELEDMPVESH